MVTVSRLDENCTIREALGKYFATRVKKIDSFSNMATSVFNGGVSVDIGKKSEAKATLISRGVGETVYGNG